jgi:hypothetical protein
VTSLEAIGESGMNQLPTFLEFLYGGLEGFVATATKRTVKDPETSKDQIVFSRKAFAWPSSRDSLTDWILEHGKTMDVYVAPAIFSKPSGKKEDFHASNVVWAEFDGVLPSTKELGAIPLPTLRLRSSGITNEHWYWKLNTPIYDANSVEGLNRSLAYQLGADVSGWDANQILRPPQTYNHKYEQLTYCTIIDHNNSTVEPVSLEFLPTYEGTTSLDGVDLTTAPIPDVQEVIFKYIWADDAREVFLTKVPDDKTRSTMLMRLGYYLAEMGLSDVEMFSVLRNADDRWGKFKERTDRNKQLTNLIAKARVKYPTEITLGENALLAFGAVSFLGTAIEISWIIEGLLQEQGYMLLTGPSGVGKTQFSLRVAINLALGRDWLGFQIAEPVRVGFLSLEMGHMDLKFFVNTMLQEYNDEDRALLEQNLILIPVGEAFYLDNSKKQEELRNFIKITGVQGLMVDSIGSCTSGSISDESTVKTLMDFNDNLRQSMGIFTWYIHHNRKAQGDNKKPNKLADVYGNQYLVNRATSVYCLWPVGNSIEVIPLKKRLAPTEPSWMVTRTSTLDFKKGGNISLVGSAPMFDLGETADEEVTVTTKLELM